MRSNKININICSSGINAGYNDKKIHVKNKLSANIDQ